MKNKIIFICFFIVLFLLHQSCNNREFTIYVSPKGNDNSSGDISNPIATLNKAVEITKNYAGKIPITINITKGEYHLIKPIVISPEYLGNNENPIVWKSSSDEKPIISGGIKINANWKKESNGLWSVDLPNNYSDYFRSLFINGKRATRARHPNNNTLRIEKAGEDDRTNFFFKPNDIPFIKDVKNLELIFYHDWSISRIPVKEINYSANNLKTIDSIGARSPSFFTITNWEKNPRYYLENAIEFCDSSQEWFCDFEKRKIYYFPSPNENIENIQATIPISEKLLTITGSKDNSNGYISFEGIIFEYTNWELPKKGYCGIQACMYDNRIDDETKWSKVPAAIELDFVNNITFKNCTVRHTDGSGIWIREISRNCKIENSHIYDISGNGVGIGEGYDRLENSLPWWQSKPEQVSTNNTITNSLIEECGVQFFGAVGIWCGLVSHTNIKNNEIRNLPYTGISVGWMWDTISTPCCNNKISSNYIHSVLNKLSDGGGIYFLGKQPGSKIINNVIHDVKINAGRAESNGMFLDEGITELIVENNIIYNIARSPIRFHRAFKNMVKENILMCNKDIPPIRYNNTNENDIVKINNVILNSSSLSDIEKLNKLTKERFTEFDLNKY